MYFCHKYREIYNMNSLIFPPYVHEGDRAIILSPSSKIDKSFLKGAKKRLKSWGLEVIIAKHAGSAHGTYAGSIQQRLKDLQEAMDDEKAKVILCSRGGSSTSPGFASIPNGLSASATSPPCTTCFSKTASLRCTLPWHGISPWSRKMIFAVRH